MSIQDTSKIKEKILSTLRTRGPSLPVHIARETGLSILFASVFLSELLSEKKIKISNMKVGNSPIYFIPGQEPMLKKFSQHLKSKEKEALMFLKQKKFLKDKEQEPAIRVALRAIKDFAIPFKKNGEIFWRYYEAQESGLEEEKPKSVISKSEKRKQFKGDELDIFDEQQKPVKKTKVRKVTRNLSQRQNEKFFDKVKEFLSKNSIKISSIESFNKKDLTLRITKQGKESLLIAYNKKRINENDLIKAHKKASELNLQYTILSLGEPLKKLNKLINAIKNLSQIEKIG